MSKEQYSLSLGNKRTCRAHWIWIWVGTVAAAVVAAYVIIANATPDDAIIDAPRVDLTMLGAQEWYDHSDLMRQTASDDVLSDNNSADEESPDLGDPFRIKGKITRNQTLFIALKNHNLDLSDIHRVIASLQEIVDFKKTRPDDKYEIELDADRRIVRFVYEMSPEDISVAVRDGNGYRGEKLPIDKQTQTLRLSGALETSLYQAFQKLGESGDLASHFMQLFKYDFDFASDSQRGDTFTMLIDKITLNGEFYRYGRVWAASYESASGAKSLQAYYYDDDSPDYAGYYDEQGRALKRTFLKTPVVGCPMTSPFNPKRMHPILKRIRPHNGIDWACPTGTPIMAFADGIVTFADRKGGNGNLLVIEHAHGYTSLYAHMYGFARGIKKGARVRQGQVVGQLGSTGLSTGPHLHFAVKRNGQYIDPAAIDTRHAVTLSGNRLSAFHAARNQYRNTMNQFNKMPNNTAVVDNSANTANRTAQKNAAQ